MTAIVHPLPRNGWSNSQTDLNMSTDDVSRMFVPRKSAQRSNSSSSLASAASSASSTSTISATTTTTTTTTTATSSNQPNGLTNGDTTATSWAAASRKKPARGIWPASSKAEPVAGLSTARSQSVPANASGPSAASAISALHVPSQSSSSSSSHQPPSTQQQNGLTIRNTSQSEPVAQLHLQPLNGTFERKIIKVPRTPDIVRIGRQTNNKTLPTPENGYFDSKVLSRQHAEVWAESTGVIFIRDVKSSNGTFVNGKRLSAENRDSEPHALTEADVLELGIDIVSEDQKTVVHHKVAARVDHAGFIASASDLSDFTDADIGLPNGVVTPHTFSHNTRSRPTTSQGANSGNSRFNSTGGASTSNGPGSNQQSKWLQPVTMEQIVKRLNSELKQARVQSSNIRDNSSYVDALNAGENPPLPRRSLMSPIKSWVQPRTESAPLAAAQPPPPPPSQPLPEAPAASNAKDKSAEPVLQPILRRSDTEKPSSTAASSPPPPSISGATASSPTKAEQSSQILKLLEALGNAQKEIANQSEKLTEMEAALNKEREERKMAEERAGKLESGTAADGSDELGSSSQAHSLPSWSKSNDVQKSSPDIDPSALQQRIELLCAEMDQMKAQMERYRQRAENAEHESQRDRKSLSEMVESIKKREEAAKRRSEKKKKSRKSDGKQSEHVSTTDEEDREIEKLDDELGREAERATHRLLSISFPKDELKHMPNGTSTSKTNMSISELQQLGKAAITAAMDPNSRDKEVMDDATTLGQLAADSQAKRRSTRQEQLAQTAPYASMLGVILLGMGLMAYLNGWQKAVER